MKRITIERYDSAKHDSPGGWPYSGLIEGETDDGTRWIMWLDKDGRPEVFWPSRDETGAVVGPPIMLMTHPLDPIPEADRLTALEGGLDSQESCPSAPRS